MGIHLESKINFLLQQWPAGTVMLTSWLEDRGISRLLLAKYKKSYWIEAFGKGAFRRTGDIIAWSGGVYTIQTQSNTPNIHVGGLTAIALQGSGHYIRFKKTIQLFGYKKTNMPRWFKNHKWNEPIEYYRAAFLPAEIGLTEYKDKTFSITISSLERAMLEALYLAPDKIDLIECYHILEGLIGLRPNLLQELLDNCSSVKVKRLFLYMANKACHEWFKFIDVTTIDLGKGKRSLVKHGVYDANYAITIPKELGKL
jgi:hypothetical protein